MSATEQRPDAGGEDLEQPFISHLIELRDRLLRGMLAILVVFLALAPFTNRIFTFMSGPLSRNLPAGSSLISIEVAAPFFVPVKLVLVLAIFIAMPYLLYQLWAFVAPGLYRHERRMVLPLLVSSTFLFYLGAAFAYFVVFPMVFGFLTHTAPKGVEMMTDISHYLDFILTMFLAFGAAFEVPVATYVLVWTGVVTPDQLADKRPYIVVAIFVIGAVLTPPDIFSQTMLAVPMWLLFEIGVFASRRVPRNDDEEVQAGAADGDGHRPMTEAEMEAELDATERREDPPGTDDDTPRRD